MAAVATGNGAFQEEEGTGGDAAAPQPHAPTSAPGARLSRLPLARVKALVKADPDVTLAGQEAIFILARAAVRPGHNAVAGVPGEGRGSGPFRRAGLSEPLVQVWGTRGARGGSGAGCAGHREVREVLGPDSEV